MDSLATPRGARGPRASASSSPSSAARDPSPPPEEHVYKMKDLCDRAKVSRQLVHFYIQQGLLPEGKKTGKNMAYYSDRHLQRLLLVRRLQHERFLPLKAIRALLEERDEAFSPAQQKHMRDVRAALPGALAVPRAPRATVAVDDIAARLGLPRADIDELIEAGLLAAAEEQDLATHRRRTVIASDDVWLLEHYAELRSAGFTPERGFSARVLAMYDEAIQRLINKEARLIAANTGALPPADVAVLVERAMPVIGSLLARLHAARAKDFFASLG